MSVSAGRGLIVLALVAGCGDDATIAPDASGDTDDATGAIDAGTCLARATYPLTISAGVFPASPDHPSVLVYVPQGFDPSPPFDVVVYIHGFDNCIENIVRDTGQPCTPGGAARNAYALAAQLEASGRNALLVCPEVAFDQASSDPGRLADDGGFRALLGETLAALPAPLGPLDVANHGKLVLASHSGGYRAAAAIATVGDVPVDELWLFDSLYAETARFDAWVMEDLAGFATAMPSRRFADVYTAGGGTLMNSQAMAVRAAGWVTADPSVLVDDRTTATWPDDTYRRGLLFKESALTHDGVPRYYFEHMLATSTLATRRCN